MNIISNYLYLKFLNGYPPSDSLRPSSGSSVGLFDSVVSLVWCRYCFCRINVLNNVISSVIYMICTCYLCLFPFVTYASAGLIWSFNKISSLSIDKNYMQCGYFFNVKTQTAFILPCPVYHISVDGWFHTFLRIAVSGGIKLFLVLLRFSKTKSPPYFRCHWRSRTHDLQRTYTPQRKTAYESLTLNPLYMSSCKVAYFDQRTTVRICTCWQGLLHCCSLLRLLWNHG